uniref:Uncharacterized protein n=1 Tax=Hemiselmis andersenii TaxID=464988 RepID=A0A7S1DID8_HEMAN
MEIMEGHGVDKKGMLEPDAMHAITRGFKAGICVYSDLWGTTGLVRERAQELIGTQKEQCVDEAVERLKESERYRQEDIDDWRAKGVSDREASHQHMLDLIKKSRRTMVNLLLQARAGVPGAGDDGSQRLSKNAIKKDKARRRRKRSQQEEEEKVAAAEADEEAKRKDPVKIMRSLDKKIREAEQLSRERMGGKNLNEAQLFKICQIPLWNEQLAKAMEDGTDRL